MQRLIAVLFPSYSYMYIYIYSFFYIVSKIFYRLLQLKVQYISILVENIPKIKIIKNMK